MKRIITIILTLSLVLGAFSGCALKKQLTAFGLYSKAVNTIRDAGGVEVECTAVMDITLLSVEMDMNIKQNGKNSEVTVSMGGEQISKTAIVDGMVYVEANGMKICYPQPSEDKPGSADISALPKLAEDLFNDVEIVEDENGGKALTVSVSGDTLASVLGSAAEALEGLQFDDAELTMYFNADDDIESMHMTGSAQMSAIGISMNVGMEIDYRFINLGTAPEITPPDDADEYTFDESMAA